MLPPNPSAIPIASPTTTIQRLVSVAAARVGLEFD
jgi:hypothetical protein